MGLFERNDYGRDYRGPGDRLRGAWNRFENRVEGGMRRGYDRPYRGDRGGGYDASDFAYRGLDGAWSTAFNRGAHDVQWDWRRAGGSPYDQDTEPRGRGYDRGYASGPGAHGYDRGYAYGPGARGYDRGFRPSPQLGRTRFGGARREWRDLGGGVDRYDVEYRGWNSGVGDEPAYPRRDFRGWNRGGR
jgi:hypothetical protein